MKYYANHAQLVRDLENKTDMSRDKIWDKIEKQLE